MNVVEEFETWIGIQVNTTKTKQMTVDGVFADNRTDTVKVTYKDEPLTITPESEVVRYLGFWVTPNDNMKSAMDLVFERTLQAKEIIQGHPLDPKQTIEVFEEKAVVMYGNSTKALKITRRCRLSDHEKQPPTDHVTMFLYIEGGNDPRDGS
jgi:hypothetical protein